MARLLRWLAVLVVLAGVLTCYLLYRPTNLFELSRVVIHFGASAIARPMVWAAAALFASSSLARWWVERRLIFETEPARRHVLQVATEPADSAVEGLRTPPVARADDDSVDRLRQTLLAALDRRPDVPALLDRLLAGAITVAASDIHIQPLAEATRVTLRLRGELHEIGNLPVALHDPLLRRLKVLSELVSYQTRQPQDGHFVVSSDAGSVDFRLSVLPTQHGERAVLRLAMRGAARLGLDDLGLPVVMLEELRQLLAETQGMILLTGPTGCGKTTTLYAALEHIHQSRGDTVSLSTLEDPVEVELPFLNQTQVQGSAGLGFAEGLRAVLRQDPDVLMVGEIRDADTARVAVRAALSGHLILSTLHAESAAGVFSRLYDSDVEPFLAASAVRAAISQRLARGLCVACSQPAAVEPAQLEVLRRRQVHFEGLVFQQAAGCSECAQSGHGGRVAIFELLRMDDDLRLLVLDRSTTPQLAAAAAQAGATSLLKAAVGLAAAGRISLEEALRVAG